MRYKLLGNLNDVWTCEMLERLSLTISKFDSGVDDDHDDDNVNYTAEQAMIVLSLNSGHVTARFTCLVRERHGMLSRSRTFHETNFLSRLCRIALGLGLYHGLHTDSITEYGHNSYPHSINVGAGITKGPCKDLEKRLQYSVSI